jgi:hypothetical protein
MSAPTPIADIDRKLGDVRLVPGADVHRFEGENDEWGGDRPAFQSSEMARASICINAGVRLSNAERHNLSRDKSR